MSAAAGATSRMIGLWREMEGYVAAAGSKDLPALPLDAFLVQNVPNVLITLAATIVGAYARLRRI